MVLLVVVLLLVVVVVLLLLLVVLLLLVLLLLEVSYTTLLSIYAQTDTGTLDVESASQKKLYTTLKGKFHSLYEGGVAEAGKPTPNL